MKGRAIHHSLFNAAASRKVFLEHGKAWMLALGAASVWAFGDSLLHLVGHLLHMSLEVIESLFDHFFAEVVGLTHRQAEVVTAYSGLTVLLYLCYKAVRKAYQLYLRVMAVAQQRWLRFCLSPSGAWLIHHWRLMLTTAGILGLSYLFMF